MTSRSLVEHANQYHYIDYRVTPSRQFVTNQSSFSSVLVMKIVSSSSSSGELMGFNFISTSSCT